VLLTIATVRVGPGLRFEPSRGGQLFPHVYGGLDRAAVVRVDAVPLGPDGRHLFPAHVDHEEDPMLHYTRFGTGKPLVLLHGFLGGTGYWVPQMGAWGRSLDVIAVDLAGFAGSAKVPAPAGLDGHAANVVALMDSLGIGAFHLLGFSMGGFVAQQLALDFPARVDRLVLYGTAADGMLPHRFESWDASVARMEREGVEPTAENTASTWLKAGKTSPWFHMGREAGRGASKDGCMTVMRAMQRWSARPRLGEIKARTLVIVGDRDRSAPVSESLVLWQGIKGAELCVLPGMAHGPHLEAAEIFNRVVGDFLLAN